MIKEQRVALSEGPKDSAATAAARTGGREYAFSSEVVVVSAPGGPRAEAIRAIRTFVMAQHIHAGRRALAICSASAGVGASFVAVNLAAALAQAGVSVLLIDGNMRRHGVDAYIRPSSPGPGLREYLMDEKVSIEDVVAEGVMENLAVMYAGGGTPDAQELLAGDRFGKLMERCMRDYEMTIIDTPPANTCADARRISTVAGYSLIVTKRHKTFVSDLTALAEQLAQDRAQVVGTVLNEA